MLHTITVTTPYFIYTSDHNSFTSAMAEFKRLLEMKKEQNKTFKISLRPYLHHPVSIAKRNVA